MRILLMVEKESLGHSVGGWRVTFKGPNMVTYGMKYGEFFNKVKYTINFQCIKIRLG